MNQEQQAQRRAAWLGQVAAWQKSGLSQVAYCQQHGLKASTFKDWVGRARETGPAPAALAREMSWVPVTVQADELEPGLVLRAGTWQLSLPATVSPPWLAQLLRALP
jgi:hypothetical protein